MDAFTQRTMGTAFASGAVLALIGQLGSPFHLLTHETTQLGAIGVATVAVHVAAWLARRDEAGFAGRWALACITWALGLQLVYIGANAGVYGCAPAGTGLFFWVTFLPLAGFVGLVGFWTRSWRFWTRLLLWGGIFLGTLLHDAGQHVVGVRVTDPFIGDPLMLDQRTSMKVPRLHVVSRIWLALAVGTAALVTAARRGRIGWGPAGAVGTVLALASAGGTSGVGWSTAPKRAVLSGEHRSEHFVFRYDPRGAVPARLALLEEEAEFHYQRLKTAWTLDTDAVVEVNVYDDEDVLAELTGLGHAHAGIRRMEVRWWDVLDDTFPHELVHTLHAEMSWHPGLLLGPGMLEGTAMAWDHGYGRAEEAHTEVAAAYKAGHLPSAAQIFHPLGFMRLNESNAYRFAGSFMGFVLLEYGVEAFLEVQRTWSFEGATGKDLTALDAEWRAFLETVEVDLEAQASARDRFDPAHAPGVYAAQCPKLGLAEPSLEEQAKALADHGDTAGAAVLYGQLAEEDPSRRRRFAAASALRRADRPREALVLLEGGEDEPVDLRLQRVNARIGAWLTLAEASDDERDWAGLQGAFADRRELEEAPELRVVLERLLDTPDVRRPVAEVLLASGNWRNRELVRERLHALVDAHPEHADDLTRVLADRGLLLPYWRFTDLHEGNEARWEEAMDVLEATGTCPDERRLQTAAGLWRDAGLCPLAGRMLAFLPQCPEVPAWRVEELRARWEASACR